MYEGVEQRRKTSRVGWLLGWSRRKQDGDVARGGVFLPA